MSFWSYELGAGWWAGWAGPLRCTVSARLGWNPAWNSLSTFWCRSWNPRKLSE